MPRKYKVGLAKGAKSDIRALRSYWIDQASRKVADDWTRRILKAVQNLETFPHRGTRPEEARLLGNAEIRQLSLKPYRILYQIDNDRVDILMVIDGRRDVQSHLRRRLLSR